jgi:hypothetical protein
MPAQSDLFYFGLNGGPNAIAQFSKTTYRGAKITVQASSNVEHQLSEMYLLHDNNLAYVRQLDFIYTTDPFVVFTATIDSNNVYLQATSGLPNTDIVIFATLFDNPVTASDKGVDFQSVVSNATAISSLYPDDKTDYAAAMTASLDKKADIEALNIRIRDGIAYMATAAFNAESNSYKNDFIHNLANTINSTATTLDETVQSDVQAYYDVSKKIDSASTLAGLNVGMMNTNVSAFMQKILNANGKSILG